MSEYQDKLTRAKSLHEKYGSISHSMIFDRNDILDAFDMVIEMFPNDKATIHYGKGNYWVVLEFNNEDSNDTTRTSR